MIKQPVCPYCGVKVRDTVLFEIQAPILWYLKGGYFGEPWGPWWCRSITQLRRKKDRFKIINMVCRHCTKTFPDKTKRQVWKYLKTRHVLDKLIDS